VILTFDMTFATAATERDWNHVAIHRPAISRPR
jgi:hypothetical protein